MMEANQSDGQCPVARTNIESSEEQATEPCSAEVLQLAVSVKQAMLQEKYERKRSQVRKLRRKLWKMRKNGGTPSEKVDKCRDSLVRKHAKVLKIQVKILQLKLKQGEGDRDALNTKIALLKTRITIIKKRSKLDEEELEKLRKKLRSYVQQLRDFGVSQCFSEHEVGVNCEDPLNSTVPEDVNEDGELPKQFLTAAAGFPGRGWRRRAFARGCPAGNERGSRKEKEDDKQEGPQSSHFECPGLRFFHHTAGCEKQMKCGVTRCTTCQPVHLRWCTRCKAIAKPSGQTPPCGRTWERFKHCKRPTLCQRNNPNSCNTKINATSETTVAGSHTDQHSFHPLLRNRGLLKRNQHPRGSTPTHPSLRKTSGCLWKALNDAQVQEKIVSALNEDTKLQLLETLKHCIQRLEEAQSNITQKQEVVHCPSMKNDHVGKEVQH